MSLWEVIRVHELGAFFGRTHGLGPWRFGGFLRENELRRTSRRVRNGECWTFACREIARHTRKLRRERR